MTDGKTFTPASCDAITNGDCDAVPLSCSRCGLVDGTTSVVMKIEMTSRIIKIRTKIVLQPLEYFALVTESLRQRFRSFEYCYRRSKR